MAGHWGWGSYRGFTGLRAPFTDGEVLVSCWCRAGALRGNWTPVRGWGNTESWAAEVADIVA